MAKTVGSDAHKPRIVINVTAGCLPWIGGKGLGCPGGAAVGQNLPCRGPHGSQLGSGHRAIGQIGCGDGSVSDDGARDGIGSQLGSSHRAIGQVGSGDGPVCDFGRGHGIGGQVRFSHAAVADFGRIDRSISKFSGAHRPVGNLCRGHPAIGDLQRIGHQSATSQGTIGGYRLGAPVITGRSPGRQCDSTSPQRERQLVAIDAQRLDFVDRIPIGLLLHHLCIQGIWHTHQRTHPHLLIGRSPGRIHFHLQKISP